VRRAGQLVVLVVVLLVSAACSGPNQTNLPEAPVVHVAEAAGFSLQVGVPRSSFSSTDVIPVEATLTWVGPAPQAAIWGSGMGPASFVFAEVGGRGRTLGGVMSGDCRRTDYARGVSVVIPLRKSSAYAEDDPDAAFYMAWNADPQLRLPAGHWQIQVSAGGFLTPCEWNAPELRLLLPPIDLDIR
jgi:hypothetical protein